MDTYLRIDDSLSSTLAICEKCGWRELSGSPATAWKNLAIHAKRVHADPHAVNSALHAKWWHEIQKS